MENSAITLNDIIGQLQYVPQNKLVDVSNFIRFILFQSETTNTATTKIPNKTTRRAMKEIENGDVIRATNVQELLSYLKK